MGSEMCIRDRGKEKRFKNALENLRKQHLWGGVSDEKYQTEKKGLERRLNQAAPPTQPHRLPNLERAAQPLEELPGLWQHRGVTDEQREALVHEMFHRITIDGKAFASIEPPYTSAPRVRSQFCRQQAIDFAF